MTTTTGWKCWRDPDHEVVDHPEFGWPQCVRCKAAPPYHDRAGFMADTYTLGIYVPVHAPTESIFAPGSALVGFDVDQTHVQVYYEGFIYGDPFRNESKGPRAKWVHGIRVAADRAITAYPTVATAFIRREHLLKIGTFAPKSQTLLVDDETVLDAWVGVQSV